MGLVCQVPEVIHEVAPSFPSSLTSRLELGLVPRVTRLRRCSAFCARSVTRTRNHCSFCASFQPFTAATFSKWKLQSLQLPVTSKISGITSGLANKLRSCSIPQLDLPQLLEVLHVGSAASPGLAPRAPTSTFRSVLDIFVLVSCLLRATN